MNTKRQAWEALQRHTPEIIPAVKLIAERFGVSGVRVETEGEIVEWTNG